MTLLTHFALWSYALLLRLYPHYFQEEYGAEVTAVFQQHLQQAAATSPRDALAVIGRELRDWPLSCLREHARERNRQLLLPRSSFLSGWGAIAAAGPFLITLFLFAFNFNLPRYFLPIVLAIGILIAWWQRWPGWVVSWLGLLIFYGQNWLPYSLFSNEFAWNTVERLVNNLSEVLIQVGWLWVMYWVVRRWPRHGALVFLQFLLLPWAFSLEFVSEAMTAVIFTIINLILALTAVAIVRQRTLSGDIWLMVGGALLSGMLLSWGGMFFSPEMNFSLNNILPELLVAVSPFLLIILLQTLNAWGKGNGRSTYRLTWLIFISTWLTYFAVLAASGLLGPSDLEVFQLNVSPTLIRLWLLGVLVILVSLWRLRPSGLSRPALAFFGLMFLVLPLLNRPTYLTSTVRSMTYNKPAVAHIAALLPIFETTDLIIFNLGIVCLLLLPWAVGQVRGQTAAFPQFSEPVGVLVWWRRRRERSKNAHSLTSWAGRRRLRLLLVGGVLLAGGTFLLAVFLPLQLDAEPYTQQVALGDVDGDGDGDVLVGNEGADELWLNDGNGRFSPGPSPPR